MSHCEECLYYDDGVCYQDFPSTKVMSSREACKYFEDNDRVEEKVCGNCSNYDKLDEQYGYCKMDTEFFQDYKFTYEALVSSNSWCSVFDKKELETTYMKNDNKVLKDQSAKADAGKPEIGLVPMQFVIDVAKIRSYGNKKYGDPDNWKNVEWRRYWDAMMRHLIAAQESGDPLHNLDAESGLSHLSHALCNGAFLAEFAAGNVNKQPEKEIIFDDGTKEDDDDEDNGVWVIYNLVRPPKSGIYYFNYTHSDEWTWKGYYIKEFDVVIDTRGLKLRPDYWREIA